jgi:hypothetical protein
MPDHGAQLQLESLDFLYLPTPDAAAEVEYLTSTLGAQRLFAIERFGTRVACVQLTAGPPDLLLAEHLEGQRPVLVYRVADLDATVARLIERGWAEQPRFEIPFGPCCELTTPAGHRVAIYERTRPELAERLAGRRDF